MHVKDGLNAEQVAQQKLVAARVEERRRWAEMARVYSRCVQLAEAEWSDRLDAAQAIQQRLAEEMRDRMRALTERQKDGLVAAGDMDLARTLALVDIPVPLFTPRDRLQFLKEVTTALLIEAGKRNLGAMPEPKEKPDAAPEQAPGEAPAGEAASGTSEADLDAEARELTPETAQ